MRASRATRFVRQGPAIVGAAVIASLVAFSTLGPLVTRDPLRSDFTHGATPSGMPVGPGRYFALGTDRLFRDVLARLAIAGRLSLSIALASTLIASGVGAAVGIAAGWNEGQRLRIPWPAAAALAGAGVAAAMGRPGLAVLALSAGAVAWTARRLGGPAIDVDGLLMRGVDVLLAFPFLLLVMAIGAALDETSAATISVLLGATGWLGVARVLRAKTMQVRAEPYVSASRALGQSTAKILVKHVLPNVSAPLVVSATLLAAQMIVADSALAYLGVGIAPPTPTWGRMLYEGQDYYASAPWLVAAPGVAILLSAWGFNLLGEGLRDALDPRAP